MPNRISIHCCREPSALVRCVLGVSLLPTPPALLYIKNRISSRPAYSTQNNLMKARQSDFSIQWDSEDRSGVLVHEKILSYSIKIMSQTLLETGHIYLMSTF